MPNLTLLCAEQGEPAAFWIGFTIFVVVMLVLDLLVFHKKPHEVSTKEALGWSVFWIALALAFNAGIYFWFRETKGAELAGQRASEFFTAYVLEKSLSVDNLFVIVLIFQFFKVPGPYQHRVLFLGIVGAIVMRFAFILAGSELLHRFAWMTWVMGGVLVVTAVKLALAGTEEPDPSKSRIVRFVRASVPYVDEYNGPAMTVVRAGKRYATPLLLVLIVIELTDVVFAVDSVPACLAVSDDFFVVFTSNIFAVLGLRALYFVLARFLGAFHYLKYGLAIVLAFVGVKMILSNPTFDVHIGHGVSLVVIAGVLGAAVAASLAFRKPEPHAAAAGDDDVSPAPPA